MSDPVTKIPEPKRIMPDMLIQEPAFYAFGCFSLTVPVDWTPEDIEAQEAWIHVMSAFRGNVAANQPDMAGALIYARREDHGFFATYYVRAVLTGSIVVECIGPDFDPKTGIACKPHFLGDREVETRGYSVRWNVGKREYDVRREVDNEVVHSAKTKELCAEWIGKMSGIAKAA